MMEYIILLTGGPEIEAVIFFNTFYSIDEIVHSIFVIKYWVLSKKVHATVHNKGDKLFKLKLWSMITIQFLLILIMSPLNVYYDPIYHSPKNQINYIIWIFFYNLPVFIVIFILSIANWNLKDIGGN